MGAAAIIGEIAKEIDISLKELSRRVDIPYTTLYNAVKRDSKMDFETVQKIADALGVLWYNLYCFQRLRQAGPSGDGKPHLHSPAGHDREEAGKGAATSGRCL